MTSTATTTTATTTTINRDEYAEVLNKATVRFQRLLPGPLERVWAYITEPEKRQKWFASGDMDLRVGGQVHLVFKNSELSPHVEEPPAEHSGCGGSDLFGRITEIEAPHRITFTWGEKAEPVSEVTFELAEKSGKVLLTVTHAKLVNRDEMVGVSGGWHIHLAILEDVLESRTPRPFWSNFAKLQDHYETNTPK